MNSPRPIDAKRVLVVRTDRIGDMILSTPLLGMIKSASPDCEVTVAVPSYVAPVLDANEDVDAVLIWESEEASVSALRSRAFDAAILLNPGLEAGMRILRAGIPYRTGPLARTSSFFFLNRGVRQARSRGARHQAEWDADFATLVTGGRADASGEAGGSGAAGDIPPPKVRISDEERERGLAIVREAFDGERPAKLLGLHPGSGGSVLAWGDDRFLETARLFRNAGYAVAITGSESEREAAERMARELVQDAEAPAAVSLAGAHDFRTFLSILAQFDHFLAPSTGPLHAAAALGVPVSAPYPPLPSQRAGRWGPRPLPGIGAAAPEPDVACPARIRCLEDRCPHHPCMSLLTPEQLFREVIALHDSRAAEADGRDAGATGAGGAR
ncbi:MAG: glycosyltransferase family 9 protein [Gemmatimonadetes bacterium]|nr:glycosyltransferase family 9 protein [Gemmatimonadota bacterium]